MTTSLEQDKSGSNDGKHAVVTLMTAQFHHKHLTVLQWIPGKELSPRLRTSTIPTAHHPASRQAQPSHFPSLEDNQHPPKRHKNSQPEDSCHLWASSESPHAPKELPRHQRKHTYVTRISNLVGDIKDMYKSGPPPAKDANLLGKAIECCWVHLSAERDRESGCRFWEGRGVLLEETGQ